MEDFKIFKKFIDEANFSPTELGEINTLIFHEWNEEAAEKFFPPPIISIVSKNNRDEALMDQIYHALLPLDLRTD